MTAANVMPFIEQNQVISLGSGGTLGFSLGTVSTQILPGSPQVRRITFHNPGTINLYVCQATDAKGNALTAGANGGNWVIMPGGTFTFTGNGVAGPWLAAAASSTGNPLTAALSQTL